MQLPELIAAYVAAKNQHDVDAMAAAFLDDAVVKDEGRTYVGKAAIRSWMDETTRRYRVTIEPRTLTRSGAEVALAAQVTGDFPGSPVMLTYNFKLADAGITALEVK